MRIRRLWNRIGWSAVAIAVIVYVAVIGWFVVNEPKLVYFPKRGPVVMPQEAGLTYEGVTLQPEVGVSISGWVIPAARADSTTMWVLYFHGNGGNLSARGYVEHFGKLHDLGFNVLAIDYRGYGESTGAPTESGLYADAMAAYAYLRTDRRVGASRVVLFGYSLGAAVAIELATHVEAAGVILEGAFTSLPDRGQELYPFMPVGLFARNRYESREKIGRVTEPKLFLHAERDEVIPFDHGRRLFERATEPKKFVTLQGGHNDAHKVDETTFYGAIEHFITGVNTHH